MKLKHSVWVISTLLGTATSALAADASVYGRAHLGIQNSDDGSNSELSVESYASRFGVKGSHKINDSLEAVAKFEWEVAPSEQNKDGDKDENIKARSQYVGVKGNFGQLVIGRVDTAVKKSQGKIDYLNDFNADIKSLFNAENRLGDSIQYTSPKFGQVQFMANYIAEDNSKQDGDAGFSIAAMLGDSKLKKTPYYVSIGHDSDVAGFDTLRMTAQGKMGDFVLGAMWQDSEDVDTGIDGDGYMVNLSYKISDYKLFAQYQDSDMPFGKLKDSGKSTSVGLERKLTKQVRMYAWYSSMSLDNSEDQDHLAVTIRYDF